MSQKGDSAKKAVKAGRGRPRSISKGPKDDKSGAEKVKAKKVGLAAKSSFGLFINRILKNVHSDVGITKNGMAVMDSFARDLLERLAVESGSLCKYHKQVTILPSHVVGAIKLVLPPEIAMHAIEECKRVHDALAAADKSSHK